MLAGAAGIITAPGGSIFTMLALMGLQSTLFSPALNGSIPELYPAEYVTRANAILRFFVARPSWSAWPRRDCPWIWPAPTWNFAMGRLAVGVAVGVALIGLLIGPRRRGLAAGIRGHVSMGRPAHQHPQPARRGAGPAAGDDHRRERLHLVPRLAADPAHQSHGASQQFGLGTAVTSYLIAAQLIGIGVGGAHCRPGGEGSPLAPRHRSGRSARGGVHVRRRSRPGPAGGRAGRGAVRAGGRRGRRRRRVPDPGGKLHPGAPAGGAQGGGVGRHQLRRVHRDPAVGPGVQRAARRGAPHRRLRAGRRRDAARHRRARGRLPSGGGTANLPHPGAHPARPRSAAPALPDPRRGTRGGGRAGRRPHPVPAKPPGAHRSGDRHAGAVPPFRAALAGRSRPGGPLPRPPAGGPLRRPAHGRPRPVRRRGPRRRGRRPGRPAADLHAGRISSCTPPAGSTAAAARTWAAPARWKPCSVRRPTSGSSWCAPAACGAAASAARRAATPTWPPACSTD